MIIPVCSGELSTLASGELACSGAWSWLDSAMVPVPFDYLQLDYSLLGGMFTAGFTIVVTVWAAGKAVALVLSMLK